MAVETPTINKIIRMTEFDLLRTNIHKFDMYMCLDSQKLYYDETDTSRVVYNYLGIKTVNDLIYNTTPEFGRSYYCWEDNTLWTWINKWICIYSDSKYPSAYVYSNWNAGTGDLNSVYRYDMPNLPADDNGLLHDGSVIIRDPQRIIKGKLYIDEGNDNLVISSFLGGGVRILPNGSANTAGELFISDENDSFIRSQFTVKNGEIYVNYAENPLIDPARGTTLERQDHNYKVFHEGNLDASLISALTGQMVYNALITDKSTLPDPFDFNVYKVGGKTINEISLVGHKHTSADITDFNTASQQQATAAFHTLFSHNLGTEGITITEPTTGNYVLSANNVTLTFTGGATGTGTITHLTNTSIALTVDPTQHTHSDLSNSIQSLQNQINSIVTIDPANYYNKTQVDGLINGITPTTVATPGKALLVDNNSELPVTVTSAHYLTDTKTFTLTGDITGTASTDFSTNTLTISTSASNIISNAPTQGKALAVDANGNLPGNASTASALNHTIALSLTGEATGTGTIDTSTSSASINVTLVPGNNIVQTTDIGVTVASLDSSGKVPTSQLPSSVLNTALRPQGTFDPTQGVPSLTPAEGDFWVSTTEGTISGLLIEPNDLYSYINSNWQLIASNNRVISINNRQGKVTLDYSDLGAISDSLINYTLGQTVPANKIPLTDSNGHLAGVKVDALTNTHSFITSSGDVQVNTTSSTRTSTDGSQNFDVQLDITQAGYQNILDQVGYVLQKSNVDLQHKQKLNFGDDFELSIGSQQYTLGLNRYFSQFNWYYIDDGGTGVIDTSTQQGQEIIDIVNNLYVNRSTKPAMLVRAIGSDYATVNNNFELYILNSDITTGTTGDINIYGLSPRFLTNGTLTNGVRTYNVNTSKLTLTFVNNDITTITFTHSTNSDIDYLPIDNVTGSTQAYIPTYDAQPASKKYVDDTISSQTYKTTIGDGVNSTFTITHNLNTQDIIVQFRNNGTKKQVYIDNTVINSNSISVDLGSTIPALNEITVTIIKL